MFSKPTKFEGLLEAVSGALVGMDQAGVIRFVNHQTELLFGYDRDDLVGQHIETLVPEYLWPVYTAHQEGYFADPRTRSMGLDLELKGRRRDGTRFPLNISLSHIDTGDVLLTFTAAADVSKHRREFENAQLTAAMVEQSSDAIYGGTLDGIITIWNPAAEKMYGCSSREIIGRSVHLLCPEDRWEEIDATLARIRAGQQVAHLDTIRVRKDGTLFPAMLTISPIRDESGAVVGAFSIARDVTDLRQAVETAHRLAAIVENSDDAIVGSTLDGVVTSWNPAAQRMFGYRAEEMIGRDGTVLSLPDRLYEGGALRAKVASGRHVDHFELIRLRQDGTPLTVSLTISPIRDEEGAVVGLSAICRDVTRQSYASQATRSMIESSLDSLVAISPEGMITDVNEATVRVTGVPREELVGTSFSDYFTDPEKANVIYQLVFTEGMAVDYPLTMRHQDGKLAEVLYNASVYRDTGGEVLGVFAAARDVTEQKRAQREMAEEQARALERVAELELFQRATVGRELKMIDLKKEIEYLRRHLPANGDKPGDQR